jgi:hypothetical protein
MKQKLKNETNDWEKQKKTKKTKQKIYIYFRHLIKDREIIRNSMRSFFSICDMLNLN